MPEVQEMYDMWLSGKSVRKIAYCFNIGRGKLQAAFRKAYGKDACNPRMQGLARIVYQEYGDKATAGRAKDVEGLYLSQKTMDNHSKAYRNVRKAHWDENDINDMYYDYVQEQEFVVSQWHDEGMLLPLYLLIAQMTRAIIAASYADALVDIVD